jgi:predicted SAM-dependent methyltransferase
MFRKLTAKIYYKFRDIYRYVSKLYIYALVKRLENKEQIRIIVGSGDGSQRGWIPTNIYQLDLVDSSTWNRYFSENSINAILGEHVLEHLTAKEAQIAAENCFFYLRTGGYIRVAVPDGFKPSIDYINAVKPGGDGLGSEDHKVLYNYISLTKIFVEAGFVVNLLEYYDEEGQFHYKDWNSEDGHIFRSYRYDERNRDGCLNYTSLILDAWKR